MLIYSDHDWEELFVPLFDVSIRLQKVSHISRKFGFNKRLESPSFADTELRTVVEISVVVVEHIPAIAHFCGRLEN